MKNYYNEYYNQVTSNKRVDYGLRVSTPITPFEQEQSDKEAITTITSSILMNDMKQLQLTLSRGPWATGKVDAAGHTLHERSLLSLACEYNRVEAVKALLFHGALVDGEVSTEPSPLIYALGNQEIIRQLLAHGANCNIIDPATGDPFIHRLISSNIEESTLQLAIQKGVDLRARNRDGELPVVTAIKNNRYGLCRHIWNNGGKPVGQELADFNHLLRLFPPRAKKYPR